MTAHGPGLHDYPFIGEPPQPPTPPEPPRKRWYRRWPAWIGIGVIAVFVTALIAGLAGGRSGGTTVKPAASPPTASQSAPDLSGAGSGAGARAGLPPMTTETPTSQAPKPPVHNYDSKFGVPYVITKTDPLGDDAPTSATYTVSAPTLSYGDDDYTTPKHGQYVTFSVTITAATDGVDYNSYMWEARDATGAHYNTAVFGPEPTFDSGTLHAGEKVRGNLTFDMPTHGTLAFSASAFGAATSEWKF